MGEERASGVGGGGRRSSQGKRPQKISSRAGEGGGGGVLVKLTLGTLGSKQLWRSEHYTTVLELALPVLRVCSESVTADFPSDEKWSWMAADY